MKKIYKIITLVVAPLFFTGCFSLDQQPYEDLSQANSFKTVQDAQFWVNGMYNTLRTNVYGSAMYATDLQADFLNMTKRDGTNETITIFKTGRYSQSITELQLLSGNVIGRRYKTST